MMVYNSPLVSDPVGDNPTQSDPAFYVTPKIVEKGSSNSCAVAL